MLFTLKNVVNKLCTPFPNGIHFCTMNELMNALYRNSKQIVVRLDGSIF
jgi:hypothetical protein